MEKIEVWWLKMVEIFTRPVSECYNEYYFSYFIVYYCGYLQYFFKCIQHIFFTILLLKLYLIKSNNNKYKILRLFIKMEYK